MDLPRGGVACGSQAASGYWLRGAPAVQLRSPTDNNEHNSAASGTLVPSPAASVLPPLWPSPAWLYSGPPYASLYPQSSPQANVAFPLMPLKQVASHCCQTQQYSIPVPRPQPLHTKLQVANYDQLAYTDSLIYGAMCPFCFPICLRMVGRAKHSPRTHGIPQVPPEVCSEPRITIM